jgi:hypothetical protein
MALKDRVLAVGDAGDKQWRPLYGLEKPPDIAMHCMPRGASYSVR